MREEEVYEEEFTDINDIIQKLARDSLGKEITAKVEAQGRIYLIKLREGKIVYSELDPKYKGKIKLLEVNE